MSENDVNHPDHYTQGPVEVIETIKATVKDHSSYLHGNIIKYVLRALHKGGLEDFKKARVYLDWLIEELEGPGDNIKAKPDWNPPVLPKEYSGKLRKDTNRHSGESRNPG